MPISGEKTAARPPLPFHHRTSFPERLLRLARVAAHLVGGLSTTVFVFPWIDARRKQSLIRKWSQRLLRMLNVELRVTWRHEGGLPGNVLIVANHISWLDIFVLDALRPARFIAKAELRSWPVVGRLVTNVGTLYIERARRRDTHKVNRRAIEALARGDVVAVFPEGTTSDGTRLLHFHSSLLQPIVDAGGHVQPVAIRYRTPADEYSDAPAFGELNMIQSFWRVTGERRLIAELHFTPPLPAHARHRRELSQEAAGAIRTVLESRAHVPAPGTRDRRPA